MERKPCPFCGSENITANAEPYRYLCLNCGCINRKEAWNTRIESAWEMFRGLNNKYGVYFDEALQKYFYSGRLE